MKVHVCNTITYFYDVEIPEWMCEKDDEGNLKHEALLVEACYEADKAELINVDEWDNYISAISTNKEELYIG